MSDLAARLRAAIDETERVPHQAAVLRRCAADRKLLDLHARTHQCPGLDPGGEVDGYQLALDGDCLTIAVLAEGYGIQP